MRNALQRGLKTVLAVALLIGVLAAPASAQATGRIVGLVTDASSMPPLNGVQVFIPGTSYGTLTNQEGRYLLLNVPAGSHTIRALVIGYAASETTVNVAAGETVTLDLSLSVSAVALDEVVVTGQGRETARREIGNTITTVNTEALSAAPVTSMSELLQGRAAGMTIMSGGGQVGQGSKIILRGAGSIAMGVHQPSRHRAHRGREGGGSCHTVRHRGLGRCHPDLHQAGAGRTEGDVVVLR
jgi:hypothetical protein